MVPPVVTEAALGRVVVYRNGVAYFQRHATVHGNELKLEVPVERLDDFLKSLTVKERKSGRAVPISFPTLEDGDDEVTIRLELPKNQTHELEITYVTESPSWKPPMFVAPSPKKQRTTSSFFRYLHRKPTPAASEQ